MYHPRILISLAHKMLILFASLLQLTNAVAVPAALPPLLDWPPPGAAIAYDAYTLNPMSRHELLKRDGVAGEDLTPAFGIVRAPPMEYDPNLQCARSFGEFRQNMNLKALEISTTLTYLAKQDANSCNSNGPPNEIGYRVQPVIANTTIMTDAILMYWQYLWADGPQMLKNPDISYFGCSWSNPCPDKSLFFRCKFTGNQGVPEAVT